MNITANLKSYMKLSKKAGTPFQLATANGWLDLAE
jgi:hypothetical protein